MFAHVPHRCLTLLTNILHTIMSIAPQQSPTDINVLLSYLANYIIIWKVIIGGLLLDK